MKRNKKLIASFITLSIAFVCVLSVLFGVWAATSQDLNSRFTVKYDVANNIAVKITASYQYYGEETATPLGSIQYNVDDSTVGSIENPTINLSVDKPAVKFIFEFENVGENEMVLSVSWADLENNLNSDGSIIEGVTTNNNKNVFVLGDPLGANWNTTEIRVFGQSVPLTRYELVIRVADINKSAYCYSDDDGGFTLRIRQGSHLGSE